VQHLPLRGAERDAQTDLARTASDEVGDDGIGAEDRQGERGEAAQDAAENAGRRGRWS
jgi:hypothetical protein